MVALERKRQREQHVLEKVLQIEKPLQDLQVELDNLYEAFDDNICNIQDHDQPVDDDKCDVTFRYGMNESIIHQDQTKKK